MSDYEAKAREFLMAHGVGCGARECRPNDRCACRDRDAALAQLLGEVKDAVLEALEEPTKDMIEAARLRPQVDPMTLYEDVWRAMIRAAREKGERG